MITDEDAKTVALTDGPTEAESQELKNLIAQLTEDDKLREQFLRQYGAPRFSKHTKARALRAKAKAVKRKAKRKA